MINWPVGNFGRGAGAFTWDGPLADGTPIVVTARKPPVPALMLCLHEAGELLARYQPVRHEYVEPAWAEAWMRDAAELLERIRAAGAEG